MNKKKDPYGYVYERNTTVNMKCTSIAGMEFILSTIVSKASLNQMKSAQINKIFILED